jgi:polysaccharide biosynthesis protein PslH
MRILWVATKAPSPIADGGRAVMSATIQMLAEVARARVSVVTPLPIDGTIPPDAGMDESDAIVRSVQQNPRFLQQSSYFLDWPNSIIRSLGSGRPVTIERHAHAALAARVAAVIREEPPFDIVHAEQLQALPIAEPARRAGIACVLRAQNVESAIWDATASEAPTWRAAAMRFEARRLRRFEADAIAGVDATIALSPDDAAALTALCPSASARITVVAPPIPSAWLTAADTGRTEGTEVSSPPVFVWIGSTGWSPNDAARKWLLDDIWPAITARVPDACLHVFGSPAGSPAGSRAVSKAGTRVDARDAAGRESRESRGSRGSIEWRGAPRESAEAFLPGGILLIPMRAAAGVRMRVLEAWARGVPVIASPAAVVGLDTEDGRDVLIAADARAFAEAAASLTAQPSLRARLVREGRATLARRHDPGRLAEAMLDVYRQAIAHNRTHRQQSRNGRRS